MSADENPRFALWRRLHPDAPAREYPRWVAAQKRAAFEAGDPSVMRLDADSTVVIRDRDAFDAYLARTHPTPERETPP